MEVKIIDGFKFEKIGTIRNLLVESNKLPQTIDYINSNNIKGITINSDHGYSLKNIDFVIQVENTIENIDIVDDNINIEKIIHLKKIKKNIFRW